MPELTVVDSLVPSALQRMVEDYLASCRAKGLSSKTVKDSYGYPLRDVFLPWCAREGITEPSQLTSRLLDRYSAQLQEQPGKRGRPLAKDTTWTYVKAVRLLVGWAKREGEPIEGQAQLPKLAQHLPDILDRDEIRRMEDAAGNDRDQLIVRVLADTGIRNGELCGLRMQDLLERNRDHYLKVSGKGSKERLVPISPALYRRIRRYAERKRPEDAATDRLFISRRRDGRSGDYEPLTTSGIQQLVRQLAEKAGMKKRVHPHTFRHSAITYMLQKGMNAILVADIVGHADLDMIRRVYARMTPTDAHAALMLVLRADEQRTS